MKKVLSLLLLSFAFLDAAESGFWAQLTPEERAAAGVAALSPEQQAALDRAAARYAQAGAETAKAAAQAEAREAARRQKIADAGLASRSTDEPIRTRIAGKFQGWDGRTVFRLENGQVWQQTDKDSRYFPAQENPEVVLLPGGMFGWKLELAAEGLGCRVRRVQ